jgi:hypothetical protein
VRHLDRGLELDDLAAAAAAAALLFGGRGFCDAVFAIFLSILMADIVIPRASPQNLP